ncbi:MAG: hypothetical protein M3306_07535, partial [Actinomycetota bacterium]|nr:hypothetical protein [Actinomycetota bacterium]
LTRQELERAIELISPAEAYVDYDHPNVRSWRDRILPALIEDPEAEVVAVFIGRRAGGIRRYSDRRVPGSVPRPGRRDRGGDGRGGCRQRDVRHRPEPLRQVPD